MRTGQDGTGPVSTSQNQSVPVSGSCGHIRLLRCGFCLEQLEEVGGDREAPGEASSCWYSALSSFTSSSTSLAWPQAAAASLSSLSASARATSTDSFPFALPASPSSCAPPRTSVSSRSVFSSFWLMSSCSWLRGAAAPGGGDAGEPTIGDIWFLVARGGSECDRISSMEAQRFFSAVVKRFPACGVWAGPVGVCSHATAVSRGRLCDFPEASAVLADRALSVLDLGQSGLRWDSDWSIWKRSQPTEPRGEASSSWIRSRVSIPSEDEVDAWRDSRQPIRSARLSLAQFPGQKHHVKSERLLLGHISTTAY